MDIRKNEVLFRRIYGPDPAILEKQYHRYDRLAKQHTRYFGDGEQHCFSVPGRTEIGGNHTDHNHGRVLAASVSLDAIAVAAKHNENRVVLYSEGYDGPFSVDLTRLEVVTAERETTAALIRGIAARFRELGYRIGGFNACLTSAVLPGSGLSSSAAVEVLIGTIFNVLFNDGTIPPETIAAIGQYAENHYFGKPCGLMDQMACAVGGIVHIDFKDPQQPLVEKVDFDFAAQQYRLLVVNTGGSHADLTADYAAIPAEMKAVARALGTAVCRDIMPEDLLMNMAVLREQVGDRALLRALHFLGDNERVTAQVTALKAGDFSGFLQLVRESGNSSFKWLQNIYSGNDGHEQGVALALALSEQYIATVGQGACRVHGGGFAGTIQVYLPESAVPEYVKQIEAVFGPESAMVLNIRPLGAVHISDI